MSESLEWKGRVGSVQPRIRLLRSFDERSHSYLGYVLRIDGALNGEEREFTLGIGKGTQAKHEFAAGMRAAGFCTPVPQPDREPAEYYRASGLRILDDSIAGGDPPPWLGRPPALEIYRGRGHRRLNAKTYEARCVTCIWGCRMAVEMLVDHWDPSSVRYRSETFCYGPKSCRFYRPGQTRKVPGRKGMVWEEEDWVDEEETAHRDPDE